jgi:hypothetical protein
VLPLRELRHHLGLLLRPVSSQVASPERAQDPALPVRDRAWGHCRNALGIARLLVHEGRPAELVDTACQMALEAACRAALDRTGLRYDGDVERSLQLLAAPHDLLVGLEVGPPAARLAACERGVGFLANYLRSEAPERSWRF